MKRRFGEFKFNPVNGKKGSGGLERSDLKIIDLTRLGEKREAVKDTGPLVPSPLQELFDRAVSLIALTVLLPLYVVTAVCVRFSSPGPIIYRQVRIGMNRRGDGKEDAGTGNFYDVYDRRTLDLPGKPFIIYKFRTMVDGAENQLGPIWARKNDPRVTWVGKILRRLRIDETPQFFNVLKGDMSLIGPRPERPTFVRDLIEEIPEYAMRLRVKPGITGLAQVAHHYDTCLDDVNTKLRYDLEYVRRRGVGTHLSILFRTVWVVFSGRGAR